MPNDIVAQLKNHVFELFLARTAPGAQDARCLNYNEDTGSCIDQGITPCPDCANYVELIRQFDAIPVG